MSTSSPFRKNDNLPKKENTHILFKEAICFIKKQKATEDEWRSIKTKELYVYLLGNDTHRAAIEIKFPTLIKIFMNLGKKSLTWP